MEQIRLTRYVIAFVACAAVMSDAVGATVYKCIGKMGSVAYQPEPCGNASKTDRIEIKEFIKPKTEKNVLSQKKWPVGMNADARSRQEEKDRKACRKLMVDYSHNIRDAKAKDRMLREEKKKQDQNRKERDNRALNKFRKSLSGGAKSKREYKRYMKKNYYQSNYREFSDTYNQDMVERKDREARKKLDCDRFR